ncbi:MAG: glycosyltransferase family 4 protein [Paludibacter sp.]|nr:glycosyltransferase family 4 protein [Paludibacter sp.]
MKLLYFIPALYNHGGMERVLSQKVNFLADYLGYQIVLVTTDQDNRPAAFMLSDKICLIHLDINFSTHYNKPLFLKLVYHYIKLNKYKKEIYKILKNEKPDVLISLGGKEIDFLYKLKTSARKVCEMHFSMNVRKLFLSSRKQSFVWKLMGDIRTNQLKRNTRKLDKLVVLTKQDKAQWELTHKNVINIVNPNPFQPVERKIVDSKIAISVGRLDEQKGYTILIDSWKLVADKHPDWKLYIFGAGELKQELTDKIIKSELRDKVYLKGLSNEIEKEYMSASFFVMSSLYEGLPLVLLEAMSFGLPVVSFDCEWGPRELIQDGKNGFLVPVKDTKGLATKINQLIENLQLRSQMSIEATKTSGQYDIKIVMDQWDKMFKVLVGEVRDETKNEN